MLSVEHSNPYLKYPSFADSLAVSGASMRLLIILGFYISGLQGWVEKDCNLELSYLNITLICHRFDRPAVRLGVGAFNAVDHLGNFDLNDTVLETVGLPEFEIINQNTFAFSNPERNVGINLVVYEDELTGLYELQVQYPEEFQEGLKNFNRIWLDLFSAPDEYVFGAGEQFTFLNLKGRKYPIWVREQGVGRNKSSTLTQIMDAYSRGGGDYHTTYWPQSSFISSRGFYFESSYQTYHELDFTEPDRHTVYWHMTVPSGEDGTLCTTCHLTFIVKPSLLELVQVLNPGQPPLPEWVYNGAILGVQGGTDLMLQYLDTAQSQGVQVAGLWIQDWSGKITTEFGTRVFWNWEWNKDWYPELDSIIQDLAARNITVTAYITAHLNMDGEVYKNCSSEDYWLTQDSGELLVQDFGEFNVTTVDIIQEPTDCNCINTARAWFKDLMTKNLIDLGLAGWMADFGEYTPTLARSKYAERWWAEDSGEILHQIFSLEWAKLNREVVEEAGKLGEILYWMRSGGIGSKDYQVLSWAGDQTVDWTQSDGLPSSIVSALSLAMSGMGLTHSDIGGYTTIPQLGITRTKELFLRWAEYSVFTPVMRTHEGNIPAANHQFYSDRDTLVQFGRLTRIYVELSVYTRATVQQNSEQSIPVMRPLFLMFEADPLSFKEEYEYMYGDDLLVSPVLQPGVQEWSVYLPAGETWVHLWTKVEYAGGEKVSVPAPMGNPPVFYRKLSKWSELFKNIGSLFS